MEKLIAVKRNDGGVDIIYPMPEMFDKDSRTRQMVPHLADASEEQIWQFIIAQNNLAEGSYRFIERADLPSDYFRDAWHDEAQAGAIQINLDKAKEIKRQQFRELRKPLLAELDGQYFKAVEAGQDASAIVTKKQLLRDLGQLELPNDLAELEKFMPECLL